MKGLTDATSWDVAWCPKHQTAKWCCWFDGHYLKKKEYFAPFIKRKSFFLFTHASSPFPLETSGSFFKFNSFLFICLFIFLNLIFYLFIRSLQSTRLSSFFNLDINTNINTLNFTDNIRVLHTHMKTFYIIIVTVELIENIMLFFIFCQISRV